MNAHLASLDTLFQHAPIGLGVVDRHYRYAQVNEAMAKIIGLPADQIIGRRVPDIVKDLWPRLEPVYPRVLAGETVLNHDIRGKTPGSASQRCWLVSHYPVRHDGSVVGIGIVVNDITERIRIEEALRTRNDLYAMLSLTNRAVSQTRSKAELYGEVCRIAVETGRFKYAWIGEPDGRSVRLAAQAGEDDGYMKSIVITLDEEDARSQGPTGRALLKGVSMVVNDFMAASITAPWHEAAGRSGFGASATFPLRERGRVVAALNLYAREAGYFSDDLVKTLEEIAPSISFALDGFVREAERRRDEEELRLRDRAIRAVSQGIVITDPRSPDNPIIYVSPGFERITGYASREVIGRNCRFMQAPETDPAAVAQLREAILARSACTVELLNRRKDGTTFWNSLAISPVMDEQGEVTHFVGIQTDVTERRRLEAQFRQAQKMEAVGHLAGGVAHDFNNLLTVICGYSNVLARRLTPDHPLRPFINEIEKAGERAASLTRQLLAFSRQQVISPRWLNLNEVVRNLDGMFRRLIGEDIRITTRLEPGLAPIHADVGQIEQLIVNLVVNARDAMPGGGELTIETRTAAQTPHDAARSAQERPEARVALIVQDTGCGMDESVRSRIFEPFFTTKGVGKGTGLGLSTVHGIVQQSRGDIAVDSEPGKGTRFTILLPCASDAQAVAQPLAVTDEMPPGNETILLVEDENAVRDLVRQLLMSCGYRVLVAADGEQALMALRREAAGIQLLITDVIMPYMSGIELARHVQAVEPACKVLYLSGYTDDVVLRQGVEDSGLDFLQKPFKPATLAAKVREVLDR